MNANHEIREVRKIIGKKLHELIDITFDLEAMLGRLDKEFFRVCIFGSARLSETDAHYKMVEKLAYLLSRESIDIVTGGGPGLMEAANRGAQRGRSEGHSKSRSIGLPIDLPFEEVVNPHLDVKSVHRKFSSRLDEFMRLTHAVVVTPGGIGTLLELVFAWQLLQVGHIRKRPVILLDRQMWEGLIDWMKKEQLSRGLVNADDFDFIYLVDNPEDALSVVKKEYDRFKKSKKKNKPDSRSEAKG